MADQHEIFQQMAEGDGRYRREAYAFTLEAFNHTMEERRKKGLTGHISGMELCEGIRRHAEHAFGYLTKTVFSQWGVTRTDDFGEIVFGMIEHGILSKHEDDRREDFADAFSFDDVFEKSLIYD